MVWKILIKDFLSIGGRALSTGTGLIQVVNLLMKHGFASKIEQTLDHQRGDTGVYDAVDMILLLMVGIVVGAVR